MFVCRFHHYFDQIGLNLKETTLNVLCTEFSEWGNLRILPVHYVIQIIFVFIFRTANVTYTWKASISWLGHDSCKYVVYYVLVIYLIVNFTSDLVDYSLVYYSIDWTEKHVLVASYFVHVTSLAYAWYKGNVKRM